MKKRTRTLFFILFFVMFLISVPLVVFYAQGYRWDFERRSLVKTGALSIGAQPHAAEILVEGRVEGSISFLSPNVFVSHLIPQEYNIEVRRQGYHSWSKVLPVKQGEVTEALHVRLYPQEPLREQLAQEVRAFFPQEEGRAALFVARDTAAGEQNLSLILFQPETNDRISLGPVQSPSEIKRIVWADESERFFLVREVRGKIRFETGETKAPYTISPITSIPSLLQERALMPDARFMFMRDTAFLYAALPVSKNTDAQEIFRINLSSQQLEGPLARDIRAIALHKNAFYVLEGSSRMLVRYNKDFTDRQVLTREGPRQDRCELSYSAGNIFALCRGDLFLFEEETNVFGTIASEVQFFHPAPDGMKVIIARTNEVLLYWLEENARSPRHKKGDMELILRLSRTVEEIIWLHSPYAYIGVVSSDMFRIVELDSRDGLNIVPYRDISVPLVWLGRQEAILALHEGNLVKMFLK